jgi:hypothetical protein
MLPTATVSKRHYALLGMLFFQKEPERAQKYISDYIPSISPESDLSKIDKLFKNFCRLENLDPEDRLQWSHEKLAKRRLFIAVIIHLYHPKIFFLPQLSYDRQHELKGFVKTLATVLQMDKGNASKNIREAIFWEKQYEDFAQKVSELLEKIQDAGANS